MRVKGDRRVCGEKRDGVADFVTEEERSPQVRVRCHVGIGTEPRRESAVGSGEVDLLCTVKPF